MLDLAKDWSDDRFPPNVLGLPLLRTQLANYLLFRGQVYGMPASKGWRKLRGHTRLKDLIQGVSFIDGEKEHTLKESKLQRSSENNSPKETAA